MQKKFLRDVRRHNRPSHFVLIVTILCHKRQASLSQFISGGRKAMRVLFLLVFSFCMLSAEAGRAEILAICGGASGAANTSILRTTLDAEAAQTPRLALWRDAKGYDLLLNWGMQTQRSLRAEGAEIIGNEMGSDLVHLVVIRNGTQVLEHYLFSFEEDAPGQLIWNGPEDASGVLGNTTTCFRSK